MQEVLGKEIEGLCGLETFKGLPTISLKTKLKLNLCDTQRTQSLLALLGYWLSGEVTTGSGVLGNNVIPQ